MFPSDEFEGELETDVAAFIDPRSILMGVRILCAEESLELDGIKRVDNPFEYNLFRTSLGIAESGKELEGQLPLNMHMHYLNGISFDKGCYIGQELTQRTFHTGEIRRIAMPFVVLPKEKENKLKIDSEYFVPL